MSGHHKTTSSAEFREQIPKYVFLRWIKASGRLIEQYNRLSSYQGLSQTNSTQLSSGQLIGLVLQAVSNWTASSAITARFSLWDELHPPSQAEYATCSTTRNPGIGLICWGIRDITERGSLPPSTAINPAEGRNSPAHNRSRVVFPAPLRPKRTVGPISPRIKFSSVKSRDLRRG